MEIKLFTITGEYITTVLADDATDTVAANHASVLRWGERVFVRGINHQYTESDAQEVSEKPAEPDAEPVSDPKPDAEPELEPAKSRRKAAAPAGDGGQ